ncbi:hypothetical protein, partial [Nocardia sp. NPDC004711]
DEQSGHEQPGVHIGGGGRGSTEYREDAGSPEERAGQDRVTAELHGEASDQRGGGRSSERERDSYDNRPARLNSAGRLEATRRKRAGNH